jgi:glycosyltransferase involved in cell wall biosynthesis
MSRILTCYYKPKPGGFCKRLFRAINALLDAGHTVHYLAVIRFPIDHPDCHFHRFPWPEKYSSGYPFWGFFLLFAPLQLLYIGIRYQMHCLFAFGYIYSLLLQPLRLLKGLPLALFLRADAIENHRINKRSGILISLESLFEGLGIFGTLMYGVSATLTKATVDRHSILRPSTSGLLRNEISKVSVVEKESSTTQLPLRLACVGVLEARKNQRFLCEVMRDIKAEQAQLYLYGTGQDESFLQETVQTENLDDRVHFMGWIDSESIWPEVDLLLMPSLHEGAPNPAFEV